MKAKLCGNAEVSIIFQKEPEEGWRQGYQTMAHIQGRAQRLAGFPQLYLAATIIKVKSLQAISGEDAFKPPALWYCFSAQEKQEDMLLVQIQDIARLLGRAIISTIVTLASVRHRLQQAATELGENLTTDKVLALEELDGPVLTHLGNALRPRLALSIPFEKRQGKKQCWGHVEIRVNWQTC